MPEFAQWQKPDYYWVTPVDLLAALEFTMEHHQIGKKIISLVLLATLSLPAYAYLDPGTGSIIFQAIIASVVMGFATIRLWWDKFISLFSSRKSDKESKKQDTESEEVVVTDKENKS